MKTNYQLVATGIAAALAVGVALGLLLHHLKRLIKTSWLYDRVWTFWSLHFNRPVCQVHGPWLRRTCHGASAADVWTII